MLLKATEIYKSFRSRYGKVLREVLGGVDLKLASGEKIAIVGPSGSGKTTLLNLIGTLDFPDQGDILFNDNSLSELNQTELANFRNKEVGFIFQFHNLLPQLTLWENVLVPVLASGNPDKEVIERAAYLLHKTSLYEIRNQKPGELSGGECQRTAVVRALINNPQLILADEPTGSLDRASAENLIEMLIKLTENEKKGLILVTHSMEIASKMDKVYFLEDGKLNLK